MHATQDGGEDTACLLALRESFRAPSRQAIETGGSQQECNAKLFLGKKSFALGWFWVPTKRAVIHTEWN